MEPKKLQHRTEEESTHEHLAGQHHQHGQREFGSVEELLRCDAAQTVVPPGLAARVRESARQQPEAKQGWWQRVFGR